MWFLSKVSVEPGVGVPVEMPVYEGPHIHMYIES